MRIKSHTPKKTHIIIWIIGYLSLVSTPKKPHYNITLDISRKILCTPIIFFLIFQDYFTFYFILNMHYHICNNHNGKKTKLPNLRNMTNKKPPVQNSLKRRQQNETKDMLCIDINMHSATKVINVSVLKPEKIIWVLGKWKQVRVKEIAPKLRKNEYSECLAEYLAEYRVLVELKNKTIRFFWDFKPKSKPEL